MEQQPTLRRHAELFDNMADALGVDLEEAVMTGRMPFDDVADAVLRCTGCSHPDKCGELLSAGPVLDTAPDYCRNRRLMASLRSVNG